MGYSTILFDMDGTVLDTLQDLWASTNAVLRELGHPERSLDDIRSYVGNGARNQIRCALPEGSGDDAIDDALSRYRAHYAAHCRDHTKPYPGVVEALRRLKDAGKKLAVVSNKPDAAVRLLAAEHFGGLLDVAIIKKSSATQLIPTFLGSILGQGINDPAIEVHHVREVSVECDPPLPMQFDGEVIQDATTPFTMRILPGALCTFVDEVSPFSDLARLEG